MLALYTNLSVRLRRDEKGATAVEYGIMVALIAVAIIVAVTALGGGLTDLFQGVKCQLGGGGRRSGAVPLAWRRNLNHEIQFGGGRSTTAAELTDQFRREAAMSSASERGAVAVEFAILAPLMIMLLLGIMEFGRAYNVQITLSNAAREGVRVMAINNSATPTAIATAKTATKNAAASLSPGLKEEKIVFSYQATPATTPVPTACAANVQVTATIDYTLSTMTGIAGPFAMKGVGTMQCGG